MCKASKLQDTIMNVKEKFCTFCIKINNNPRVKRISTRVLNTYSKGLSNGITVLLSGTAGVPPCDAGIMGKGVIQSAESAITYAKALLYRLKK